MQDKTPPDQAKLRDILPTEPLLLMGAGPVPIAHSVSQANGLVINHLGDAMSRVTDGVQQLARYVFQTEAEKIIGVAGPATAAMEMAIANLLWPGRKALVLEMGTFSSRWAEIAERTGAEVVSLKGKGIEPITSLTVEQILKKNKAIDVLIATHGETSAGTTLVELPEIAKVAKKHGALIVVDAVTSVGIIPVMMDDWGLDAVVAGGQKGLGSIPGVSLIAFSDDAWDQIKAREYPLHQWCYDAKLAWGFWGGHSYHYTAPVPGLLAMHAALELIHEEGLETRWERHKLSSTALQRAIEAMGLELFAPENYRLQSVVAIKTPDGADSNKIRSHMARTFGVEISGAFGHNIMRIGQMGEQCRAHNLFKTLYALGMSCRYYGVRVDVAKAMSVLEENLSIDPETFLH